ncbi:HesB/IscA family protein [Candidatus Kinetoplastidibacterium galati]|uniref:Iron-sulfur cluster assembly protein n=1 Tax=Candidatus Kinetoplastidibacterium galati TCC219 TaxID=1208921 RepID=M1M0Y5_9PROT|nr:iron-sulfur cluster assembly accessory protein [Candidatus Kinetoplastibacterium galatii]AGF48959.1 iron-sulfur cluster assembly protein [Candidatus Kinetoplastibacterium galatii TCC219]
MSIDLTKNAASHIDRFLKKRGKGIGLRMKVQINGCSGLSYKIEYVDDYNENDIIFENFGIKIFIDPDSLIYLDGTILDYVRDGFKEGFKYINPNEKSKCGCGKSFMV